MPSAVEAAKEFNRIVRLVTREVASRYPNDAMLHRYKQRIMTALDIMPLTIVDRVGPHLYRHREQIYEMRTGSEDYFLDRSYDDELKGKSQAETVAVAYIIEKIKEMLRGAKPEERREYVALVIEMLDHYIDYRCAVLEAKGN